MNKKTAHILQLLLTVLMALSSAVAVFPPPVAQAIENENENW
jgi:hypothetical protein